MNRQQAILWCTERITIERALELKHGATRLSCKEFVEVCAPLLWARTTAGTQGDKEGQA